MLLLLAFLVPFCRAAVNISSVIPNPVGVNIHFLQPASGEMDMLANGGWSFIRMDFDWASMEHTKGQYDFSAYDVLMQALDSKQIRPIFILDYSNPLYDDGLSPHTDEGRLAFATWAVAGAQHFLGKGILWEMYNEPNIGFWKPQPNVNDYIALAKATGQALKNAFPDEAYIGPATSGMDMTFLENCFKGGLLDYWDAVSVHPYRSNDPETASDDFDTLAKLIDRYKPKDKEIPIISSEWGYTDINKGFDVIRQAKMLPRQALNNLANKIALSIWYDWHDDCTDPKDGECHFGTVYNQFYDGRDPCYDPKPAYQAARTAYVDTLKGRQFVKDLANGNKDFVLQFTPPSDPNNIALACWTIQSNHTVSITAGDGTCFLPKDYLGNSLSQICAQNNAVQVPLSDSPLYLLPQ